MSITYPEAAVIGLLQGVTELFPVSSLGHSVLVPALVGGRWQRDLSVSAPESPYLAFIVGLHVATALALLVYFRRDWVRVVGGLVTSIREREVRTPDQRLAWMLVLATIPVGIVGLLLEHAVRTAFSRPVPTSIFLMANGLVLLAGEGLRRRAGIGLDGGTAQEADGRIAQQSWTRAVAVGSAQCAALLPGISRSGSVLVAGMLPGKGRLEHGDAARFSFLLATPVILAAGVLKLPDLFGPLGAGIHGQVLLGSVLSFVGAYVSVAFLTRFFRHSSATRFGVYCLAAGAVSLVVLLSRG